MPNIFPLEVRWESMGFGLEITWISSSSAPVLCEPRLTHNHPCSHYWSFDLEHVHTCQYHGSRHSLSSSSAQRVWEGSAYGCWSSPRTGERDCSINLLSSSLFFSLLLSDVTSLGLPKTASHSWVDTSKEGSCNLCPLNVTKGGREGIRQGKLDAGFTLAFLWSRPRSALLLN